MVLSRVSDDSLTRVYLDDKAENWNLGKIKTHERK